MSRLASRRFRLSLLLCSVLFLSRLPKATAQIYGFSSTGSLNVARGNHTATLLQDGTVLIAGGGTNVLPYPRIAIAELYHPADGSFSTTSSLLTPRDGHTATLLANGTVLIVGGYDASNNPLATAELYDPTTATFKYTGSTTFAQFSHTATRLMDGRVLIAGGSFVEIYDPTTGTFAGVGTLSTTQFDHTATLLNDGRVLIAGGFTDSAEIYDPATNSLSPTGSMTTPRVWHSAALLTNGKVLIAGGDNPTGTGLVSAELYDPIAGTFTATGSMPFPRRFATASVLNTGQVLIAGGDTGDTGLPLGSAELYDPATASFSDAGNMITPREFHAATSLADGTVLLTGGAFSLFLLHPPLASAELYGSAVLVDIEIKPLSTSPVPLNLNSGGTTTVAILSSPSFDAQSVDPATVTLAGAPVQSASNGTLSASIEDVNSDGLLDLVLRVDTAALQLTADSTSAVLRGRTSSGRAVAGSEAIKVVH